MAASKRTLVIIAFAAPYVIQGSTYLGIKFSIKTIPPFLMAGARFVLAGMIMYAIAWSQGIGKSTWANWRFMIAAESWRTVGKLLRSDPSSVPLRDRARHAACSPWRVRAVVPTQTDLRPGNASACSRRIIN
jgi:hypothetical protein